MFLFFENQRRRQVSWIRPYKHKTYKFLWFHVNPWLNALVWFRLFYIIPNRACVVECSTETVMADECYGWKLDKWFKNQNTTEVAFKLSFVLRHEHLNCAYFIACTCISEKNLVVAEHYRISVKNCIFFHHYIYS